jgi:hypothetical protein
MKTIIFLLLVFTSPSFIKLSEIEKRENLNLQGSWELMSQNGNVASERRVRIITNGYFSEASFDTMDKDFKGASAGTYTIVGNRLEDVFLSNPWNSDLVNTAEVYEVELAGNTLRKVGRKEGKRWMETWKKLEATEKYPLSGAWRISGRMRDGNFVEMPDRPRKTLKILSENRFQWIALNSETKEFFGTGGGTYEVKDAKYTEHIEFFSRDSTRVGMSLSFDIELTGDGWHHSGKGSTGNPVDEIWIQVDKN